MFDPEDLSLWQWFWMVFALFLFAVLVANFMNMFWSY